MTVTHALSFGVQLDHILHDPITLILILAIADVVSGALIAVVNNQYKSRIFKKGVITHIAIVLGLYLFKFYAGDFGLEPLIFPFAIAFILMYISSLYENFKKAGGKLPKSVEKIISENTKENKEEENEE